jgi:hypothetical protein
MQQDNNVEELPLPAIFGHCEKVYDLMRSQAEPVEVEGTRIIVWQGFLTHLIGEQLNMPTPYYTSIRNNLVRMGCVKQLQRGGGNSPSQWEMVRKPTPELFREKAPKRSQRDLELETMRGQLSDLNARLAKLESNFGKLVEFANRSALQERAQAQSADSTDHTHIVSDALSGTHSGHTVVEKVV